jgi:hypothetical protein
MKASRTLCGTLLTGLLLSVVACGGGHNDNAVDNGPKPDAFVAAVQLVVSSSPDDTEPVSTDALVATSPESTEPVNI